MTRKDSLALTAGFFAVLLTACKASPVQQSQPPTPTPTAAAKTRAVAPDPEGPHWDYEAAHGPARWGTLSPKWTVCGNGKSQSPIDIDKTVKMNLPKLRAEFKPAALRIIHHEHIADVINNGHTIQVNYTEGDELGIGDETFKLLQYHFHSPSEHTVAGKHFPMEMHLVHESAGGRLAVVGAFIEEGQSNAAFDPIWSNLPTSKSTEFHSEHVMVDVDALLPVRMTTYRYDGSLTTPPCSEGVQWLILTTPVQLSRQQIDAFRSIINGNNRPVQQQSGRAVVTDAVFVSSAN